MKLGKLSMPMRGEKKKKSPMEDDMADMFGAEESEEVDADLANEMSGESEGETDSEEPAEESEDSSELSSIPDEDLMAELRKRGLISKAMSASKKPSPDSEYE